MKDFISKKQLREFGFLLGIGFPLVLGWIVPLIGGHFFRQWTLWVGIPALAIGVIKPSLLFYPYQLWMTLGHALGWINSRIILGLVFIIVLQPIAFSMRMLGYDPLRQKKNNKKTYREIKKNNTTDLTRIF